MKNAIRSRQGFTLFELLLYTSIAATLLFLVSGVVITLFQVRTKNQTIAEVDGQGLQAMQVMMQTIRNATAITSPAPGGSAASLTLDVLAAASDPTVFDLSSGALRIIEGVSAPVPLTNSRVAVSGLTFQNLTRPGTRGTVRVSFTMTAVNPALKAEFSYEKAFIGNATLRHQ